MRNNIIPFYPTPDKELVKSKGCYQYDSEGKQYIDFESGVWCANLGHSNDKIINLMESQIKESVHHGYKFRNRYAELLSEKLQSIVGYENGSSVFLSSGSEAINLAITLARHITGRKKILKIDNTYISAYGYGQVSLDNLSVANVCFDNIDSLNQIDFNEIAAFVIETGGASIDMVQFPNHEFISQVIDKSIKNNCLIIADEVTTGIGRTGKWFGFQHYNFTPDMVVMGKALGNGYPISTITICERVGKLFDKLPFRYAQSHQNDPLGCAIGLEVVHTMIDENLILKSAEKGSHFKEQLEKLKNRHLEKIREIRGRGLMLALSFEDCVDGESIDRQLFNSGFIVGCKINTLRFLPPLIISKTDIDLLIEKLDELLS